MKNCFEINEKTEGKNVGNVGKLILLSASQERPNYLLTRQNGLLLLRNKNVVHNKNKAYLSYFVKAGLFGTSFQIRSRQTIVCVTKLSQKNPFYRKSQSERLLF